MANASPGISISATARAPSMANATVYAIGENIFFSILSNVNSGIYAIIIISIEKKIGLPISTQRFTMFSFCSSARGLSSLFLSTVSSITIDPSTIIPKSIAPRERRFAWISVKYMKIKAISSESGIVIAITSALRQLPRNIISTPITSRTPKSRVCETVFRVAFTRWVLSRNICMLTSSGRISLFSSSIAL